MDKKITIDIYITETLELIKEKYVFLPRRIFHSIARRR